MSLAEPAVPDGKPGPGLTLNLSSNNPFRNPRTASPALPSPVIPTSRSATPRSAPANSERPISRNPFLAAFEQDNMEKAASKPAVDDDIKEIFENLSVKDGPANGTKSRPEGPKHRPTRSDEERRRMNPAMRPPPRRRNPDGELVDILSSPEKGGERRLRRNSESSVADKPMTEEERRRREKHRKDRETRHRDSKRDGSSSRHHRKKPHGLDVIDKLDVTGIYGAGLFHHDGPFDACNPHRNRKKDRRAPMQAFPANSANMALGGSGPVNPTLDLNKIHGLGTEGYKDYGTGYEGSGKRPDATRNISFDPYARTEPVHGEETFGLGTSTFLEGAPASRKAIERRESELEAQQRADLVAGGVGRKKSIAQRLRGMSTAARPRPPFPDGGIRSPGSPEEPPPKLRPIPTQTQSAGGPTRAPVTLIDEQNPFDTLYDEAYDKKGAQIKRMEDKKDENDESKNDVPANTDGPLNSPKKEPGPLERRATTENNDDNTGTGGSGPSGFLNRVKSLKGGRRPARNAS